MMRRPGGLAPRYNRPGRPGPAQTPANSGRDHVIRQGEIRRLALALSQSRRAAIREHRSQWTDMNPAGVPEPDLEKNVDRETQVIAWPSTGPERVLNDILENL
jgi:hypothetical protein